MDFIHFDSELNSRCIKFVDVGSLLSSDSVMVFVASSCYFHNVQQTFLLHFRERYVGIMFFTLRLSPNPPRSFSKLLSSLSLSSYYTILIYSA